MGSLPLAQIFARNGTFSKIHSKFNGAMSKFNGATTKYKVTTNKQCPWVSSPLSMHHGSLCTMGPLYGLGLAPHGVIEQNSVPPRAGIPLALTPPVPPASVEIKINVENKINSLCNMEIGSS